MLRTGVNVTGPVLDDDGRVIGVTAEAGPGKEPASSAPRWSSPPTASPAGSRSRMGLAKREDRPIGVAVRRYYRSPGQGRRRLPGVLAGAAQLQDSDRLLPGYGWIFGLGDGRVNVGLGVLNSSKAFGKTNYRQHAHRLARLHPRGLGDARRGERRRPDPRRGAADGLQPGPALHPRCHAGRRLRRHGQPVQRRGHRVRDGVRRAGRRGRRPGAGPAGRRRPGAGPAARTRRS